MFKFLPAVLLLTVAPVPPDPVPVGTVFYYGASTFRVAEIKHFPGGKFYRVKDSNPPIGGAGWWISSKQMLATIRDPGDPNLHWDLWDGCPCAVGCSNCWKKKCTCTLGCPCGRGCVGLKPR